MSLENLYRSTKKKVKMGCVGLLCLLLLGLLAVPTVAHNPPPCGAGQFLCTLTKLSQCCLLETEFCSQKSKVCENVFGPKEKDDQVRLNVCCDVLRNETAMPQYLSKDHLEGLRQVCTYRLGFLNWNLTCSKNEEDSSAATPTGSSEVEPKSAQCPSGELHCCKLGEVCRKEPCEKQKMEQKQETDKTTISLLVAILCGAILCVVLFIFVFAVLTFCLVKKSCSKPATNGSEDAGRDANDLVKGKGSTSGYHEVPLNELTPEAQE